MTGLFNALTEAGYPVSIHDLSNRDNLKSSYGDDGVLLTHASEEALCLTLYCALGLLIEKGITVKLNKSNAEYLVNFPAVKIEVVPNREGNTIIRGKINKSDGRRTPDEDRINANDIHNGGKEYSYPIKIPYSNSELSESIIIESKGRGLKVNDTLFTTLYIDSYDRSRLPDIINDIAYSPLKFFRAIILRGKRL